MLVKDKIKPLYPCPLLLTISLMVDIFTTRPGLLQDLSSFVASLVRLPLQGSSYRWRPKETIEVRVIWSRLEVVKEIKIPLMLMAESKAIGRVMATAPLGTVPVFPVEQPASSNRVELLYERFYKQGPSIFLGGPDVIKAEQWLTSMNKILNFMGIIDNDWEEFMSVTKYTTKFDRLARLVFGKMLIDFSKKKKYLAGLNAKIRHDLMIIANATSTYAHMVEKAPRGTHDVYGVAAPPTFSFGRGSGDSSYDQKRKAPSTCGGSSVNKRF
uniref:Uncharacterized protein n=1 Tax=Cannabis sativa TaxID=3483 RepID=A0A803QST3_CANSA